MSFYSIASFIEQNYPEYYSIEHYPVSRCVCIRRTTEEWGILGNFAKTPLKVNGVAFKNAEQLFQLMKFTNVEPVSAIYRAANPKYTAKHWEKTHRRPDWGHVIVDAMKFCLQQKYEQSEVFRDALQRTSGFHIVEDQSSFPKKNADTWGAKLIGDEYVGPNLLGRLLMELREKKFLEHHLPENAFMFAEIIKSL